MHMFLSVFLKVFVNIFHREEKLILVYTMFHGVFWFFFVPVIRTLDIYIYTYKANVDSPTRHMFFFVLSIFMWFFSVVQYIYLFLKFQYETGVLVETKSAHVFNCPKGHKI